MELLHKLGIDWFHLLAQAINFAIVLVALRVFLYKPVLKMLKDRKERIESGLKKSEEADKRLEEAELDSKKALDKAKKEAANIVSEMKKKQDAEKKAMMAEVKESAGTEVKKAREEIKKEKLQVFEDIKKDVALLSLDIAEKIIKKEVSEDDHKKLIDEAISNL